MGLGEEVLVSRTKRAGADVNRVSTFKVVEDGFSQR